MGGAFGTHGTDEKCIKNLFKNPERKRHLNLEDVEYEGCVDWLQLAQDSPVASCCV
jgi:hypothetical protein